MKAKVLKERYLLPNETEEQMYDRVGKAIGNSEQEALAFSILMQRKAFLPNSPTLVNAGTKREGGLSACYVIPITDSLDGIYKAVWDAARVHKYYGGTGFDFSKLRRAGALIQSTGGKACGPVKVLHLLNSSAEVVAQGGKREGANMGILRVDHPDIREFVHCKDEDGVLTHFNISVAVTDEFMKAVEEGKEDECALFNEIVEHAWKRGDPGLLFLDRVNRDNPVPGLGRIEATNPCGEQPLLPYESCNLGSINLSRFVTKDRTFDEIDFISTIRTAVRFLDNVIEKNKFPIPEIQDATIRTRKIGLGVMGWHDCLIKMGIPYCSDKALDFARHIGELFKRAAHTASKELAEEKGVFPTYNQSIWHMQAIPMRNATVTTIAPTGTLSFLAECSSGIEPNYSWKYTRTSEQGTAEYTHPLYQEVKRLGLENETSMQIPWEWHIKHQAVWQGFVDNAVSKTINMPATATVNEVMAAYVMAWKSGCKGITVYRDGSKDKQVLKVVKGEKEMVRDGKTFERQSGCGTLYLTTNNNFGRPWEAFVRTAGGCEANNEAIGRLISGWLQDNGRPRKIAKILRKVRCINAMRNTRSEGRSCADVIGVCMESMWGDSAGEVREVLRGRACPSCGGAVVYGEGCAEGSCTNCGWSGCS